ncbi:MAG: hypothetical protein JXN62_04960 [Bacteroidales bacterium]|nr:hypothetical protein [Bacteroidales bacterium]
MKKIVFCLMVACLSFTFLPLQSNAATISEPSTAVDPKPAESAEAKALLLRLDEIDKMDKKKMDPSEKKELRKEVKSIKKNLRDLGPGIYLSGAALVLIVILLIVLL